MPLCLSRKRPTSGAVAAAADASCVLPPTPGPALYRVSLGSYLSLSGWRVVYPEGTYCWERVAPFDSVLFACLLMEFPVLRDITEIRKKHCTLRSPGKTWVASMPYVDLAIRHVENG